MKDIHFSYGLLGLVAVATTLYVVRLARIGRAHEARAARDGGSVFLSVGVMELGYWFLRPIVALLDRLKVTPNGITVFSIVPGLAAGVAVAAGWFGLGCLLATVAAFCDTLDGIMARRTGGTDAGQALDSIVDRVTEFGLMGGLIVYFRFSLPLLVLAVLALSGAYLISYTTAKAEAMGIKPPRGTMRRAERAVYLLVGCAATPVVANYVGAEAPIWLQNLPIVLAVALIAVVANISAATRTAAILDMLKLRSQSAIDIRSRVEGGRARPRVAPDVHVSPAAGGQGVA